MSRKMKNLLLLSMLVLSTPPLLLALTAQAQSRDNLDVTPIMRAVRDGELEVVTVLLEQGVDLNAEDSYGWTALRYAVIKGDLSIVRALLDKGADPNAIAEDGSTALHHTARAGQTYIAKALLDKGANINHKDADGWSALMYAAKRGDNDSVKLLIGSRADINAVNNSGHTALTIAIKYGQKKMAELLKKMGGFESPNSVKSNLDSPAKFKIERPVALNRPVPVYPTKAREKGIQGVVVIRALISSNGAVEKVRVVSGLPYGLSDQAIEAAYKLRFKPATKDGQPVSHWLWIQIEFELRH